MTAAFSPFLALRYLATRRINILGVFGVAFAVWAMIVVNSVFTGFVSEIRGNARESAPDLLLTDLPHDTCYEPLRAALATESQVVALAPRLRHHGIFQPLRQPETRGRPIESSEVDFDHTESGFALLLGIDPRQEEAVTPIRSWLARGPEQIQRHWPVTLSPSLVLDERDPERRSRMLMPDAVEWQARRRAGLPSETDGSMHRSSWPGLLLGWPRIRAVALLKDGDPLDLLCAAFPSVGSGGHTLRTHALRVAFAGWFATGHRMFDETTVLLPIETLRTLLGHDAADPGSLELVTDVAIRTQSELGAAHRRALAERLQAAAQRVLPTGSAPCSVLDWEQQNQVFLSAVAHEQAMMQFVLFVVMLIAAFVIYATLHMMVVQKVKDIGILAAVGGSPGSIGAVFLISGLVVAGCGATLGIGLGVLSVTYLNEANRWLYERTGLELFPRSLFDLQEIPCRLEPAWVATVAIGAVVLALVVAFVPARKAARMNPVKALSYE